MAAILKDIDDVSRAQKLAGFEIVKKIVIAEGAFLVENDLLTPTMKLKRFNILKVHKDALVKLYEE